MINVDIQGGLRIGEGGFGDVSLNMITDEQLNSFMEKYFSVSVSFSVFNRTFDNGVLELLSNDGGSPFGYVFIQPFGGRIDLRRDYRRKLNVMIQEFEVLYDGNILREFVDREQELAGFSWRKK